MVSTGTEKEAETGRVLEQEHTISRSQEQGSSRCALAYAASLHLP